MRTLGRRDHPAGPAARVRGGDHRAAVLLTTAYVFAVPISTTHVIASSIMGVGATKRLSAVRWGVAGNIVTAWVLTLPAAALVAAAVYTVLDLALL